MFWKFIQTDGRNFKLAMWCNSRMRKLLPLFLLLAFILSIIPQSVSAQSSGPVYIVQSGDTLSYIASRFNVSVDDLIAANSNVNPNALAVGQEIIIPGLEGVTGVLDTEVISLGDSLRSLSRRTQVSEDQLIKLNRMISPTELYVGISLIVPKEADQTALSNRITATKGESLFELAIKQNSDPWTLSSLNNLAGTWDTIPNDVLYSSSGNNETSVTGLPSAFQSASISPLPLIQGDNGEQVALQGVHALLEPGVYPLQVEATLPDGTKQSFEQMVVVASGNYPKEALVVSTELIDPAVTKPEEDQVAKIIEPVTATKFWQGMFSLPVYVPESQNPCIYDRFGTRRSFNGSGYDYFHAGIDYGVCYQEHPLDIYAAAPGTVVFAGLLTVRGNAIFIDHGWGVYSAYFHQKEIYVTVGQQVQAGDLIGQIGSTGRVTGPHLHFEIWVNGVQVN